VKRKCEIIEVERYTLVKSCNDAYENFGKFPVGNKLADSPNNSQPKRGTQGIERISPEVTQ